MYIRLTIVFFICLVSCQSGSQNRDKPTAHPASRKDSLIEFNKNLLRRDMQKIDDYITSRSIKMTKTGTGLFIKLVVDHDGQEAQPGEQVFFTYKTRTLEGDLLYSSDELGQREFILDKSDIEAGWNEAAKLMSPADSAIVILAPHLAFGHTGDGNRVAPREILVYELRLDSVYRGTGNRE